MTLEEKIRAALAAWLDYLPWPETWTGELQRRSTSSGPAPFRRVRCDTCKGTGKLRGGWMCRDCQGRGVYHVDDYTGLPVDTSETPWEELLRGVVRCSRCAGTSAQCSRCNGTGVEPAPFAGKVDLTGGVAEEVRASRPGRQGDRVLDLLDQEHERRDSLACYHDQLQPAMGELHVQDRPAHFTVAWTLVWCQQPASTLLASGQQSLDRGLRFLNDTVSEPFDLPGEVRAAWELRDYQLTLAKGRGAASPAQAARNREIRAQHATGASVTELATSFGLNKGQVSRIVNGKTTT